MHCTRDQHGNMTTIPHGQTKSCRRKKSSGPTSGGSPNAFGAKMPRFDDEAIARESEKSKTQAEEEVNTKVPINIPMAPIGNGELFQQRDDETIDTFQIDAARTSDRPIASRVYSSLECRIFKCLKEVPPDFPATPAHLTPLVTHGGPDARSPNAPTSDCRYFCPECFRYFTQTHNVARNVFRTHRKQYIQNNRDRTICCRVHVSESRANVDPKPINATIFPRLEQIRQGRAQASTQATDPAFHIHNTSLTTENEKLFSSSSPPKPADSESLTSIQSELYSRLETSPSAGPISHGLSEEAKTSVA
jgi:hypothetical protein